MFKISKNRKNGSVEVKESELKKEVSAKEIHEEFDNAVNKLIDTANKILKEQTEEDIKELEVLRKMGFSEPIKKELDLLNTANIMKECVELQKKYSKYPYKFIDEQSVVNICKKYGLLRSYPHNFIGNIPKENRKELVNFAGIEDEDCNYKRGYYSTDRSNERSVDYQTYKNHNAVKLNSNSDKYSEYVKKDTTLQVVATPDQFDLRNKTINSNYVIVDTDPIILYPVYGGYLIITKWGAEENISELK